jgi:hypothetical protein
MATAAAAAIRRTAPRRWLHLGVAALAIAIALVGFWPTYFGPLLAGGVNKPAIIHFHAAIYVGWLALFLAQAVLAAAGRIGAHMKLGRIAIGYGVLVIVAGLIAGIGMFVLRVRAGDVAAAQTAVLGPLPTCCSSRRCSPRPSITGAGPSSTSASWSSLRRRC